MLDITQYEQENGVVPFREWFDSLGIKAALKVRTAIKARKKDFAKKQESKTAVNPRKKK